MGVPAPAQASVTYDQSATGDLAVSWHGDPARGCAEAGVCDIAGSVRLRPEGSSGGFEGTGGRRGDERAALDSLHVFGAQTAVRVIRGPLDAPFGACTDTTEASELSFVGTRLPGGRARIVAGSLPGAEEGSGFLAGRCAGPITADSTALLPAVEIPLRRLIEGTARMDFTGRGAFASGPFSGEVVSTVVITRHSRRDRELRRPRRPTGRASARPRARPVRVEVRYRIASLSGTLTTDFTGADAPWCARLDACGMRGRHALSLGVPDGDDGTIRFLGFGPLRRRTQAGALAALRSGALELQSGAEHVVPVTGRADVSWPEGPRCRDTVARDLRLLRTAVSRQGLVVSLAHVTDPISESDDPMRTRCPGPTTADVDSAASPELLASGTSRGARVGDQRIVVTLAPSGPGGGPDFSASRSGEIVLELERTGIDIETAR
ncbi:MAG TPA: hypothetical protein VF549_04180 [Solirubrobacteraceae bacterium]|jgi:hypothetical protein